MWPPFNKQRTSGVKLQGSEGMEIYIFHYYVSGSIRSQLMNIFSCRSLHIKILCLSPNETKPFRGQLHLAYSFARFKSKICQFRKTDGYEFHRITKRFLFCTKMPDAIPWTCLLLKDIICCFRIRKVNWVGPVTVFFLLYISYFSHSLSENVMHHLRTNSNIFSVGICFNTILQQVEPFLHFLYERCIWKYLQKIIIFWWSACSINTLNSLFM